MKCLPLALAAAALAASASEARPPRPGIGQSGQPVPRDCALTIGFSSYATGIDRPTYGAVQRLLESDRAVRGVSQHRWGREGEATLCARTRTRADAERLFHTIRRLVPARPRGPVTVHTASGLQFSAPPPGKRR